MTGNSYSLSRKELKKLLVVYGINERDIEAMFASMEKKHMHMNVLVFTELLQRSNVSRTRIIQILRRLGMTDLSISKVMDMLDEERLLATSGRIYKATINL